MPLIHTCTQACTHSHTYPRTPVPNSDVKYIIRYYCFVKQKEGNKHLEALLPSFKISDFKVQLKDTASMGFSSNDAYDYFLQSA